MDKIFVFVKKKGLNKTKSKQTISKNTNIQLYYSNEILKSFPHRICYLHVHFQRTINLYVNVTCTLINVYVFFSGLDDVITTSHFSETRVNKKKNNFKISASTSPINLKFLPVVLLIKDEDYQNFKSGTYPVDILQVGL